MFRITLQYVRNSGESWSMLSATDQSPSMVKQLVLEWHIMRDVSNTPDNSCSKDKTESKCWTYFYAVSVANLKPPKTHLLNDPIARELRSTQLASYCHKTHSPPVDSTESHTSSIIEIEYGTCTAQLHKDIEIPLLQKYLPTFKPNSGR